MGGSCATLGINRYPGDIEQQECARLKDSQYELLLLSAGTGAFSGGLGGATAILDDKTGKVVLAIGSFTSGIVAALSAAALNFTAARQVTDDCSEKL